MANRANLMTDDAYTILSAAVLQWIMWKDDPFDSLIWQNLNSVMMSHSLTTSSSFGGRT